MGRHVLITGASSGIGAAMARDFARRGFATGLVARREAALRAVAEDIRRAGGEAAVAVADVTDAGALRAAVERLEAELGPCAILVANAGIAGATPVTGEGLDLRRFERIVRVDLMGVVHAVAAVVPGMLRRGEGQLVVVSSMAGWRGLPGRGAYSASKAAVSTLWESLRVELRDRGIACTTVHPGFVRTPLTDRNRFPMPFLVDADRFARQAVDGILARRRRVDRPLPMRLLMGLVRHLPDALYDRLMGAVARRVRG